MKGSRTLPWIGAVLFGALAPALFVAFLSRQIEVLPLAFAVTLGHSALLGMPVALIYRARRWTRLGAVIAGGFLIGAIPGGFFAWPVSHVDTSASVDGVPTVIDGMPTPAGWLQYLELVGMLGGLGATGSIVFWLALKRSGALGPFDSSAAVPAPYRIRTAAWIAGAALLASVAVAAIPIITKDRTCHNLFRDGRTSIGPKAIIDLDIDVKDWPRLTTLFQQFGKSHGMSLRNWNESHAGVVEILGLSACSEQGVDIMANEQRWASSAHDSALDNSISIGVYDVGDGTAWQPLSRDLAKFLDKEWHARIRFPE